MIPLKILIKNFLSYGPTPQTIDFSSYPLICLSGKNGHGKSALLDAITWALWGQARKTYGVAKADTDLVHLGQTNMMVIFDFMFNKTIYRIRREYTKTYNKPYHVLDFGIVSEEGKRMQPLTEKTIRKTQDKIETMLNLTMDAFVNSAFLRQGQANEFSKKNPRDRKRVLASILGLDQFEIIRKKASEESKRALLQTKTYGALQENKQQELATKNDLLQTLENIQKQLIEHQKQQVALEKKHNELTKKTIELTEQQKQQELITFQHTQCTEQQKKLTEDLHKLRNQWKKIHNVLVSLGDKKTVEKEKDAAQKILEEQQKKLTDSLHIKQEVLTIKEQCQKIITMHAEQSASAINKQKFALEKSTLQQQSLTEKSAVLQQELLQLQENIKTLENDLATLEKQTTEDPEQKKKIAQETLHFEKRREFYQQCIAQGNSIKTELTALEQKEAMAHDTTNPSCPLCEQNLSASRKRFLKQKFNKTKQFLTHRLTRLTKIISKLKALLITQHETLEKHKKIAQERAAFQVKLEERRKEHHKKTQHSESLKKEITTITEQIKAQTARIEKEQLLLQKVLQEKDKLCKQDPTYQKLSTQLTTLEKQQSTVQYNTEAHEKAQHRLKELESALKTHEQSTQYQANREQIKKEITVTCIQLKTLRKQQQTLDKKIKMFAHLNMQQKTLNEEHTALSQESKTLQTNKETLLQEKAKIESQQEKLKQIAREHEQFTKQINALKNEIDDYNAIATALGKDGIQALLIEEAIPEIEQEANRLLARLTNNQTQIFIESLRDLKKGGTKETLDIKVSDALGLRPYEMFSGGEAFRIDFALRIAISKLLARRSGTSLQTLIIDEGFGSQDEQGLANIMDAIYKIQDDFSRVIIVSHLSAMKDQFPVHFLVQKGTRGSTVQVMELG